MADVGKPVEVLDKQLDLARWWASPMGRSFGHNFIKHISRLEKYPQYFSEPERFGHFSEHCLYRSLPYFVTDQMVDRIWQFSKGFEALDFQPDDIPCTYGFLWLAKPLYVLDARGTMLGNRVITWVKQDHGVGLAFYTDKHDPMDEENILQKAEWGEDYRRLPELALNHLQPVGWGDNTRFFTPDGKKTPLPHEDGYVYKTEDVIESQKEYFSLVQFLLACWEWMGHRLPSRALPHRQMARRLGRSNLDANEVLVIDLQAEASDYIPPATHQVVQWHYRWRSRGYQRPYRDKKTGEVRMIDVVGCIKGPEHLPLVEKDVLYKVRRGERPYEGPGAVTGMEVSKS